MKPWILLPLKLAGLSSAIWTNDADGDVLKARYLDVACDVDYSEAWLSMRGGCADGIKLFKRFNGIRLLIIGGASRWGRYP